MDIKIVIADYLDNKQGRDIVFLLNIYAIDVMGGGKPLDDKVIKNLVTELSKRPHAFSLLCYVDGNPAGLINCFEGFSTFACKPLINIHDIMVLEAYRGLGLSQKMLARVENIARDRECCKLTLEVLSGNAVAQSAYRKFGFSSYELDPATGKALFWQKPLPAKEKPAI